MTPSPGVDSALATATVARVEVATAPEMAEDKLRMMERFDVLGVIHSALVAKLSERHEQPSRWVVRPCSVCWANTIGRRTCSKCAADLCTRCECCASSTVFSK